MTQLADGRDDYQIGRLDLDAYLDRVGYTGSTASARMRSGSAGCWAASTRWPCRAGRWTPRTVPDSEVGELPAALGLRLPAADIADLVATMPPLPV